MKHNLSAPDEVDPETPEFHKNLMHCSPRESLMVFDVATPAERRDIGHIVRRKIQGTRHSDWTPSELHRIREYFGISLLGPDSLE